MKIPPFEKFDQEVERLASLRKPKIAFGMKEPSQELLESLQKAKKWADIVLVGTDALKTIRDFEVITGGNPEETLSENLIAGKFEGFIRGTLDDFKNREAYTKLSGNQMIEEEAVALIESGNGHRFFLSPLSNTQGWKKEERLATAIYHATFCKEWHITPRVAVFTGVRHESYQRKKDMRDGLAGILNQTYEDTEWVVSELTKAGFEAKNWSIDLDLAVQDGYTVLVPVNGMVGNQILRAIFLSGGKMLFASWMGIPHFYEENSRNEIDYDYHVKWLVSRINRGLEKTR